MSGSATYRARQAAGLCVSCGLASPDKRVCDSCKEKNRTKQKQRYEARKAAGKCPQCASPTNGTVLCETCRGDQTGSQRRYYRNKAAGVCRDCSGDSGGKSRCSACAAKRKGSAKKHYEKRKTEQRCNYCNAKTDGRVRCEQCTRRDCEQQKEQRRILRIEVFAAYGGPQCRLCPENDPEILEIDHIDGGGNEHRREIGQSQLYPWLKSNGFPAGFRVVCPTCNKREAKRLADAKRTS